MKKVFITSGPDSDTLQQCNHATLLADLTVKRNHNHEIRYRHIQLQGSKRVSGFVVSFYYQLLLF